MKGGQVKVHFTIEDILRGFEGIVKSFVVEQISFHQRFVNLDVTDTLRSIH